MAFCSSPKRAFEVGQMLCKGLSDKEIAARLGMSPRTVKAHLCRLFWEYQIPQDGHRRIRLAVKLSQFPIFTE